MNKERSSVAIVAEEAIAIADAKDLVKTTFECPICNFYSNFENGLKVHLARKHSKVEQLDGHHDEVDEDDDFYAGSKHFWKNGWLGGANQVVDISEEDGKIIT